MVKAEVSVTYRTKKDIHYISPFNIALIDCNVITVSMKIICCLTIVPLFNWHT